MYLCTSYLLIQNLLKPSSADRRRERHLSFGGLCSSTVLRYSSNFRKMNIQIWNKLSVSIKYKWMWHIVGAFCLFHLILSSSRHKSSIYTVIYYDAVGRMFRWRRHVKNQRFRILRHNVNNNCTKQLMMPMLVRKCLMYTAVQKLTYTIGNILTG